MAATSIKPAGKQKVPPARDNCSLLSSSGCRRTSRLRRENSGISSRNSTPLARVQAVYAKRLDSTISVASGVLTPVLITPTPGVAVMGYIHPTKKGTPEKYSILLGSLFILSIIITSF